jgi:Flagellar hook-length control protein FliK
MLPKLDLSSPLPVSSTRTVRDTATVADPRQDSAIRLDQIAIGKAFLARVEAIMQDGSSLVRFSTTPPPMNASDPLVKMLLPDGAQVGDDLKLTLLAKEPVLTFGLEPGQTQEANTHLSSTARLLGALVHGREGALNSAVQGMHAVLPPTEGQPEKIATQLHATIDKSGLFYESHLNEWASGQRSLADVQEEPQNQTSGHAKAASGADNAAPMDPTKLIPAQLDAMEHRKIIWQGELRPGQPMRWEIQEDTPGKSEPGQPEQEAIWQTTVSFEMPCLGKVHAHLRLQGEHVQMHVRTVDATAAELLKQQTPRLSQALEASGTLLDAMKIERDGSL